MNELPPDAPRLRAILEHLDQQAADNETVAIYLRLQRDKVRAALDHAEAQQPPEEKPPPRPSQLPTFTQGLPPTRFKVVQRDVDGQVLVSLHQGDCDVDEGETQWIDPHEATAQLRTGMAGCIFCRPYDVLDVPQG